METLRRALYRPLETRTTLLCLAILLLNMLDAFATLRHLEHGAEELNPLMVRCFTAAPGRSCSPSISWRRWA